MLGKLKIFKVTKVLGSVDYALNIDTNVNIIVGPNGSGKSTFLNIFYLSITRQWSRLTEYDFESVLFYTESNFIEISKGDLISIDSMDRLGPRISRFVSVLRKNNQLQRFMSKKTFSADDRTYFGSMLGISASEISSLRNYMAHEAGDLFGSRILTFDAAIEDLNLGRVLYLPTYRRIEKDLKSIMPDIEARVRSRLGENQAISRQGANYHEIISFGMEDINTLISTFTQKLNGLSKTKSNEAAQEYIRDMVRGKIKDFSIASIREINNNIISEFVSRLDDNLVSSQDKERLQKDIASLRAKKVGKPSKDMQYLGFFVEKMLGIYVEMLQAEAPLKQFIETTSRYLSGNKIVEYKNYEFNIKDSFSGNNISMNDLSSGEKQVVSIFAYLYLREDEKNIVIIDEPELSLSVPWQKSFLPDLYDTERCDLVLAVTHSPFVFDNRFKKQIIDIANLRSN